jgi:hypothetical protein
LVEFSDNHDDEIGELKHGEVGGGIVEAEDSLELERMPGFIFGGLELSNIEYLAEEIKEVVDLIRDLCVDEVE